MICTKISAGILSVFVITGDPLYHYNCLKRTVKNIYLYVKQSVLINTFFPSTATVKGILFLLLTFWKIAFQDYNEWGEKRKRKKSEGKKIINLSFRKRQTYFLVECKINCFTSGSFLHKHRVNTLH